jgi:peptidoglycan/LPS O-acetylase OafA/YrhL
MLGFYRLILSVGVLASHTHGYDFKAYPNAGFVAVVVFFFLSGYLMPASFHANYNYAKFIDRSKSYLINRFLRIYPVYWVCLLFSIFIIFLRGLENEYDFSALNFLQNFFLLGLNQDILWRSDIKYIGPAWTLDVELQYYLLLPLFVFLSDRYRCLFVIAAFCWLIASLFFLSIPLGFPSIDRSILVWGGIFLLGYCAYIYRAILSSFSSGLYYLSFVIFTFTSVFIAFNNPRLGEWVIAFVMIILTIWLLIFNGGVSGYLDKIAGDLAYPLFIIHMPVILLLDIHPGQLNFWANLLINTAASLFFALLVHLIFNRKLNKIRARRKTVVNG